MVIKVISVSLAIIIFTVSLMAAQSSTDPIFLFISNSPLVILVRLAIIAFLIGVAFRDRFKYYFSKQAAAVMGGLFLAGGLMGSTSQAIINALADYVKFFDFMFMLLAGIVLCLSALTYSYAQRSVPMKSVLSRNLPQPADLKLSPTQPKQKSV